jgi:hypothetical protein
MEEILLIPGRRVIESENPQRNFLGTGLFREENANNLFADHLISEGGEMYLHYLCGMGMANEPGMMLLSSRHQFSYDCSDLEDASILINMKCLNRMLHMESFLNTVFRAMSPGAYLIGCFCNCRAKQNQASEKYLHRSRVNHTDAAQNSEISREILSNMLEEHWFEVCDMTEIKGLTYFTARKPVEHQKERTRILN